MCKVGPKECHAPVKQGDKGEAAKLLLEEIDVINVKIDISTHSFVLINLGLLLVSLVLINLAFGQGTTLGSSPLKKSKFRHS